MIRFSRSVAIVFTSLICLGSQCAFATPSLTVHTDKQVYEYGDFLSLNFVVSELTGDPIIIHIADESGKNSAPIPIQITKLNSTIIAPVPFYKTNYDSGTYHIDVEYSGAKANTIFKIIDSDKIAIPIQYKILVKSWIEGKPEDKNFADVIRELIHFNIIKIPEYEHQTTNIIHIPSWFKNNAKWWSDDSITDNDFGLAIQYLIKAGIMSV